MSEVVGSILQFLEAAQGASALVHGGAWAMQALRNFGRQQKAGQIRRFLEELGNTSEPQVRSLVGDWAKSRPRPPSIDDREALIAVLVNLSRRARFVTTHGTARSSILRSLPLIEQMLSDIQPRRRRGEPVAPEHRSWKLERFLGMGNFGEVWMARNPNYPQPRAFKFFTRPGAIEAIRREQESLFAVRRDLGDHPNLIRFEDVELDDRVMPYIALEFAGGGSLEDWILEDVADRPAVNKHDIVRQVADGLATAHRHKIYHRDIKPANLVLTEGPRPVAKITDFGLGKVSAEIAGANASTSAAVVVGTPMYLPPEAQHHRDGRQPAQDDVFALGVVWYQLLVEKLERPPYDFADELRHKGADSHTIALISRCLGRPENRFRDAGELVEKLDFVGLPLWDVPPGALDVQYLFREYHASLPEASL